MGIVATYLETAGIIPRETFAHLLRDCAKNAPTNEATVHLNAMAEALQQPLSPALRVIEGGKPPGDASA